MNRVTELINDDIIGPYASYFVVVFRGLFPKLDSLTSPPLGLFCPLPPDRGLGSPFSSPTRGLWEGRGLSPIIGAFAGVELVLVTFGLLVCLNSPRLLVITSSKISLSSA